jgi:hypothetical protein
MDNSWRMAHEIRKDEGIIIVTMKVEYLAIYGNYETVISIDNQGWKMVKSYNSEEEAKKGHEKYIKMTKEEILKLYK